MGIHHSIHVCTGEARLPLLEIKGLSCLFVCLFLHHVLAMSSTRLGDVFAL